MLVKFEVRILTILEQLALNASSAMWNLLGCAAAVCLSVCLSVHRLSTSGSDRSNVVVVVITQ